MCGTCRRAEVAEGACAGSIDHLERVPRPSRLHQKPREGTVRALLLGERLTPLAWSGAALILVAVLATQLGPALRRRDLRDAPAEAPGIEDRAS